MTDYHVRPVNGDDTDNGLTPATAWKTFWSPTDHTNTRGGTYNCATVTDGDTVYLWSEGTTGGELVSGGNGTQGFNWYWPLENGNVNFVGVNESGIQDENTKFTIYAGKEWGGGIGINNSGANSFSAYYPELTSVYEGKAEYGMFFQNIRITEEHQLDSNVAILYTGIGFMAYSSTSAQFLNCEFGPFDYTAGSSLFSHSRYNGKILFIDSYFHDIARNSTVPISSPTFIGCHFKNVKQQWEIDAYSYSFHVVNCIFENCNNDDEPLWTFDDTGSSSSYKVIANNVFYNNNGPIIKFKDAAAARFLWMNNIFESNKAVVDENSQSAAYWKGIWFNNVFRNNTNLILNSSVSFEQFTAPGYGAGNSGGTGGTGNNRSDFGSTNLLYNDTSGADFRLKPSNPSSVLASGANFETFGLGLGPFGTIAGLTELDFADGGLGDIVDLGARKYQKIETNPIVWRRYNGTVAADSTGNFVPSNINELVSWHDASDSSTITLSGDDVTDVANKVSGGPTLYDYGSAPHIDSAALNGKDVFDLAAADGFHTNGVLTNSGTTTIFFVMDMENDNKAVLFAANASKYAGVFESGSSEKNIEADAGTPLYYVNGGSGLTGGNESDSITRGTMYNTISNDTGFNIVGGIGYNFGTWSDFRISGYPSWELQGRLAEMLVFDKNLTTEERQKIEGFLAHKWDLTGKLPSDHPYKIYGP